MQQVNLFAESTLTIKELDDFREVHVVIDDDFPIVLHQRKSNEENEMRRTEVLCYPDRLPHAEDIFV